MAFNMHDREILCLMDIPMLEQVTKLLEDQNFVLRDIKYSGLVSLDVAIDRSFQQGKPLFMTLWLVRTA